MPRMKRWTTCPSCGLKVLLEMGADVNQANKGRHREVRHHHTPLCTLLDPSIVCFAFPSSSPLISSPPSLIVVIHVCLSRWYLCLLLLSCTY